MIRGNTVYIKDLRMSKEAPTMKNYPTPKVERTLVYGISLSLTFRVYDLSPTLIRNIK